MMARILVTYIFKSYGIIAFLFGLMVAFSDQLTSHPSREKNWNLSESWFVSPSQAVALKERGAFLLDARSLDNRIFTSLPNAKNVSWEEFSVTSQPLKGKLLSKELLEKKIVSLGIKKNDILLVVGDPLKGWGEEGRIVWTLRSADYVQSFIIDGGAQHFLEELKQKPSSHPKEEMIRGQNQKTTATGMNIEAENLQAILQKSNKPIAILDVREEREYTGATPYGETRGGHIPGAKWVYYKEFIDKDGYIKSKLDILDLLHKKNISTENTIVSYCTGGVRSAFTTSILLSYGIKAQNYSGSMWEWSSMDDKKFPLIKGKE